MCKTLTPWLMSFLAALTGAAALAATPALPLKTACEALSGLSLPAQVTALPSGPVRIESATLQAATKATVAERGPTPAARFSPALPAHCRVLGAIAPIDPQAPMIQFQINFNS